MGEHVCVRCRRVYGEEPADDPNDMQTGDPALWRWDELSDERLREIFVARGIAQAIWIRHEFRFPSDGEYESLVATILAVLRRAALDPKPEGE